LKKNKSDQIDARRLAELLRLNHLNPSITVNTVYEV
jgi:hypothetical protein